MRQSSKCSFVQDLNENEILNSTSTKFASINCIAFSSQIFYLIIKNLYHTQKILLVKIKKELKIDFIKFETKEITIVVQETIKREIVVALKQNSKFKFNEFLKSFKFEKFTINFNSTSTILCFESIIKSNVVFVANSIFISISENSNSTFLRSISFCSTSTILLINQSSYLLVANQLVAQISYQHIVMSFFFNYDKRLTTFKK